MCISEAPCFSPIVCSAVFCSLFWNGGSFSFLCDSGLQRILGCHSLGSVPCFMLLFDCFIFGLRLHLEMLRLHLALCSGITPCGVWETVWCCISNPDLLHAELSLSSLSSSGLCFVLLLVCSGLMPGDVWGTICVARDQTRVNSHARPGLALYTIHYTISSTLLFAILFQGLLFACLL